MTNLLEARDLDPPMGDTAERGRLATTRALWTTPIQGEQGAPDQRIIHARVLPLHSPLRLARLGVRKSRGYHKCGSRSELDWVTAFRLFVWSGTEWTIALEDAAVPEPSNEKGVIWYDLGNLKTTAVLIEARRAGIDGWWPSWNLASKAFILEGPDAHTLAPRRERTLELRQLTLDPQPEGLSVRVENGTVLYESDSLAVGFRLNRPGFSHLSIDAHQRGLLRENLLHLEPGFVYQGPQLHKVGDAPIAAPVLRNDIRGSVSIDGNHLTYDLSLEEDDHRLNLSWIVLPDRLELQVKRASEHDIHVWKHCVWSMALKCTVAPCHVLGTPVQHGETGLVRAPTWLHAPGFGSLKLDLEHEDVLLRSDVDRQNDFTTLDLLLGARPGGRGDYLLPAGSFETTVEWRVEENEVPLGDLAPPAVQDAVSRCSLTALTHRADTGTLSNNGASMHCPISMDGWSATALRIGHIAEGLDASIYLQASLERWLDRGPGYASGPVRENGELHEAEDEYLMTGAACLRGLADYVDRAASPDWLPRFDRQIKRQLDAMKARDLDGDGLVESPYRTGVSGSGQWSTCWFDVVSYGWKCAFSNAVLYPALRALAELLPARGRPDLADGLTDWADRLLAAFESTFFNEETGWLAGWRCAENKLHDHAFLAPNGAAVAAGLLPPDTARAVMERLWKEATRVGLPDAYHGLPGNLWPIPDDDLADIMRGYPFGFYQNGGRTHSQARHFLEGLYAAGMDAEADALLERLCAGLADAAVFGGCGSGRDWRFWDDQPSGYEGLLTDQFGVLSVAIERYGYRASAARGGLEPPRREGGAASNGQQSRGQETPL